MLSSRLGERLPADRGPEPRSDFLSGIGALVLGLALLCLGQPLLAATAGLFHALGKFGSARHWRPLPGWQGGWPNLYRTLVLASRVPAILATIPSASSTSSPTRTRHPSLAPLAHAAGSPRLLRLSGAGPT